MSCNILIVGNSSGLLQKENGHRIDNFDYVVRMGKSPLKGYEKFVGTKTDMLRLHWNRIIDVLHTPLEKCLYKKVHDRYVYSGHDAVFTDLLLLENEPDVYYERSCLGSYNHLRKIFRRIPAWPTAIRQKPHIHIPERILHDVILNFFIKEKKIQNIHYYNSLQRVKIFQEFNNFSKNKTIIVPSGGLMTIDFIRNKFTNADLFVTGFDGFATPFYWEKHDIKNTIHCSAHERAYYKKLIKRGIINEFK